MSAAAGARSQQMLRPDARRPAIFQPSPTPAMLSFMRRRFRRCATLPPTTLSIRCQRPPPRCPASLHYALPRQRRRHEGFPAPVTSPERHTRYRPEFATVRRNMPPSFRLIRRHAHAPIDCLLFAWRQPRHASRSSRCDRAEKMRAQSTQAMRQQESHEYKQFQSAVMRAAGAGAAR